MVRKVLCSGVLVWMAFPLSLVVGSELADANRLFVLEKYEDAVGVYEEVVSEENREEAAEALFGVARVYEMLGRWKLARDAFQKLLREYPDSDLESLSKIQLGQCEIKLGNLRKACAVFREIEEEYAGKEVAIEAKYNIAALNVGFFGDDLRKARAAIERYRGVLDSDQRNRYVIQSNFGLGQCYILLRDYPRAIESFRTVIEKGPDTVWANYARNQIVNTLSVLGDAKLSKMFGEHEQSWFDVHPNLPNAFKMSERFAWRVPRRTPALRIYAIGFFTEAPKADSGANKVFYSNPTIHYKNYVFSSGRGTVDKVRHSVECIGKVKCTDDALPPTLTVTSGALTLDLTVDKAVFSRNVRFEKRAGDQTVQQLLVQELHLMLDSGKIEVPPRKGE